MPQRVARWLVAQEVKTSAVQRTRLPEQAEGSRLRAGGCIHGTWKPRLEVRVVSMVRTEAQRRVRPRAASLNEDREPG